MLSIHTESSEGRNNKDIKKTLISNSDKQYSIRPYGIEITIANGGFNSYYATHSKERDHDVI